MKKRLLTIFICTLFTRTFSQNLLPNGGFENYSAIPLGISGWNSCVGWSNCNGWGSPDYFHLQGANFAQLPNSGVATLNPQSGDAIMGIILWHQSLLNYREYLSHGLLNPLIVGDTYNVSFYVTNGIPNGSYGGYGLDKLGIVFSTDSLTQIEDKVITGVTPVYTIGTVFYDTTWQQFSFLFTADSSYNYITIGSFESDASSTIQNFNSTTNHGVYYYFDNISISNVTSDLSIDSHKQNIKIGPNPFLDNISISIDDNKYYEFNLYNSLAQIVLSVNFYYSIKINTENLVSGTYYYFLKNDEGSVNYGKLVK